MNHRVILCSSSTPNEGKSTVALHLALYLEKSGLKTLLIDADLRRGRLAEALGLEATRVGIADLVESRLNQWRGGVHPLGQSKLSLLPRGNPRANTVDLLARWLNRELFAELKATYDVIIIDSSPLVPVADSVHFLAYVDHILLIGRIKATHLKLLRKTAATIRKHARGNFRLIINELKSDPQQYGYGYGQDEWENPPGLAEAHREPAA
jgi:Mrp family chromosome partitioning ATPase